MSKIYRLAVATAFVAFTVSTSISASSPDAWQQMNGRVDRLCVTASGLSQARVVPDRVSFPDRLPIELRIVEGYNRQSVIDVMICAYDRRTRRVAVSAAQGRLGVFRN